MNAIAEMPAPLVFTDSAANKSAINRRGRQYRIETGVYRHGCGLLRISIGFTFDEVRATTNGDGEKTGDVAHRPDELPYLAGAEIDYTEGLEGAQFVIKNPNATSTCGCGSSSPHKSVGNH